MSDPTEDVIKREIEAARKIIQEDQTHMRLDRIETHLGTKPPPEGAPTPPPANDPKDPPKRKGLWWGEQEESEGTK